MTAKIVVTDDVNEAEMRSIVYLANGASVTQVEAWREDDGALGISVTDDGAVSTGFFDTTGAIMGNWS